MENSGNTNMRETSKTCPCCGKISIEEYEICPVCNWENDPIQFDHPDMKGGANILSLNEARRRFLKKVHITSSYFRSEGVGGRWEVVDDAEND